MANDQEIRYADVKELGIALSDARRRARLSLREVAEQVGATKHWLWTIEKGRVLGADTTRLLAVGRVVGLDFALIPRTESTAPENGND